MSIGTLEETSGADSGRRFSEMLRPQAPTTAQKTVWENTDNSGPKPVRASNHGARLQEYLLRFTLYLWSVIGKSV